MGRRHDDASLVQRARAGSADALNELFDRYFAAVCKAAHRVTGSRALADDAAQEAFVRAFAALDTFDERRPLGPWLARIAVNRSIDLVRSERRLQPVDPGDLTRLERPYEEVRGESATAAAVARLDAARRVVIVLHYWLDYSLEETTVLQPVAGRNPGPTRTSPRPRQLVLSGRVANP